MSVQSFNILHIFRIILILKNDWWRQSRAIWFACWRQKLFRGNRWLDLALEINQESFFDWWVLVGLMKDLLRSWFVGLYSMQVQVGSCREFFEWKKFLIVRKRAICLFVARSISILRRRSHPILRKCRYSSKRRGFRNWDTVTVLTMQSYSQQFHRKKEVTFLIPHWTHKTLKVFYHWAI